MIISIDDEQPSPLTLIPTPHLITPQQTVRRQIMPLPVHFTPLSAPSTILTPTYRYNEMTPRSSPTDDSRVLSAPKPPTSDGERQRRLNATLNAPRHSRRYDSLPTITPPVSAVNSVFTKTVVPSSSDNTATLPSRRRRAFAAVKSRLSGPLPPPRLSAADLETLANAQATMDDLMRRLQPSMVIEPPSIEAYYKVGGPLYYDDAAARVSIDEYMNLTA